MAWKDKTSKEKFYSVLAFLWMKITPILLVLVFFVGVCFNLWKVQELPLWLSIVISIGGAGLAVVLLGKLIKLW